jgi:hypothetical protein
VRQGGGGAGLAHRALVHRVAVGRGQSGRQEYLLDRHVPAQQGVGGAPDGTHAAVPDRRAQGVPAADRRARGGSRRAGQPGLRLQGITIPRGELLSHSFYDF